MSGSPIRFPPRFITSQTTVSQPIAGVLPTATNVQFDLGPVNIGGIIQVLLTIQPTTIGAFTNSVTVAVPVTIYVTSTNAVVQVTNVVVRPISA